MCTPTRLAGSATGLPGAGLSPASDSRGVQRASASRAAKVPTVIKPAATRDRRFGAMASHSDGDVKLRKRHPCTTRGGRGQQIFDWCGGFLRNAIRGLDVLIGLLHDAAENLALPIELMHRPAV